MMIPEKNQRSRLHIKFADWSSMIFTSRLFWTVLLLKIVTSYLISATVLTGLFIPFLNAFVSAPLENTYDIFWNRGHSDSFPYPAGMLFITALPQLILDWIGLGTLSPRLSALVYHIPLILADIAILMVLCRWLRQHVTIILWYYWASPVLFYITYLHGQLDVVAMALAILSIYFLFSNRLTMSACLLGLGIAAKLHILLILPFALVYLWQNDRRIWSVLFFSTITTAVFTVLNLPYLFSDGFMNIVLLNAQQSKIGLITLNSSIDGTAFQVIPALLLLLIAYSFMIQIRNRDLFLIFLGSAFGIILLFIPPAPGWYYWILPFFVYFFARLPKRYGLLFFVLQAAYLIYFAMVPNSDFGVFLVNANDGAIEGLLNQKVTAAGFNAETTVSFAFTVLQTTLLINTIVLLYRGVHLPQRSKLSARPFMVGIAGDSGAGKTTLADDTAALFGRQHAQVICGDDMHKWQRGHTRWNELTHLNPLANELHVELDFLKRLRQNRVIWRRHYDHDTGKFTKAQPVRPRSIMILEGLHSFYLKPARQLYDLKVFVKPDPQLLLHRKIVRDVEKRGATKEKTIASVNARKEDLEKYVTTQEKYADIIVSFLPLAAITETNVGQEGLETTSRLRLILSNTYYVGSIVTDLMELMPNTVRHSYDDNDRQVVDFDRPPSKELIALLGMRYVGRLETLSIYDPPWKDQWSGLLQLFMGYCIFSEWGESFERELG